MDLCNFATIGIEDIKISQRETISQHIVKYTFLFTNSQSNIILKVDQTDGSMAVVRASYLDMLHNIASLMPHIREKLVFDLRSFIKKC